MPAEAHLTSYELDALQVGEASPTAQKHLEECGACAQRLGQQREADAQLHAEVGYARTLTRLESKAEQPPRRWAWVWLPLAASLAVGAVVLTLRSAPDSDETRLKGTPTVRLVTASGDAVTRARPGDSLWLTLGNAGRPFAVVFAVDQHASVTQLWPEEGSGSGRAPPSAKATLGDPLVVTPGSVVVYALLSETALTDAEARQALALAREQRTAPGVDVATLTLSVESP